jgi:hypothetical protein
MTASSGADERPSAAVATSGGHDKDRHVPLSHLTRASGIKKYFPVDKKITT